jgi:hypothetical protein
MDALIMLWNSSVSGQYFLKQANKKGHDEFSENHISEKSISI